MFKHIRVVSDLHLEAFRGRDISTLVIDFLPADERDADSVLVLAGDISADPNQLVGFIREVESRFIRVIYVSGNHEYYRHEMDAWNATLEDRFIENLSNTTWGTSAVGYFELDDVRFIFGTLWADGGKTLEEQARVGYGLNDFRVIRKGLRIFNVRDMQDIHREQKASIDRVLKDEFDGVSVVVTHHLPSYRLCHPRFGTEINGGFASNCEDILAYDHAPALWIFGHSHDSHDDRMWKTRLVSNPVGYPREFGVDSEYNTFKQGPKFIDVQDLRKSINGT